MIIDSHLHVPVFQTAADKDIGAIDMPCKMIFDEFKRAGIHQSILMQGCYFSYCNSNTQIQIAEQLKKIIETYPDKFYAFLWLNPLLPASFLTGLLQEFIVNGPLTGVKLTIQMNARDKRLDGLCRFIEKHDIPVLWHSWYKTTGQCQFESDPSDIAYFAKKFPGIRILMAHLTAARARGIQDIKACPNVSVDTSGSQPEDGYMEYALKHIGADRILFGSDYPCRDIPVQLARIESVALSKEERAKILYGNALKFFRKGK